MCQKICDVEKGPLNGRTLYRIIVASIPQFIILVSPSLSIFCYHKLSLAFCICSYPIYVRISQILISSIQQKRHQLFASVFVLRMPYHPSFEIRILYILYNHTIRKSHIHIIAFTIRNNLCFKSAFHNSLFRRYGTSLYFFWSPAALQHALP